MTWNLRLIRHVDRKPRRVWYAVHEVYYTDAGKPWAMTQDPVEVEGDTPEEVFRYLNMIRRDLRRMPIMHADKIKWAHEREDIRESVRLAKKLDALKRRVRRKTYSTTNAARRHLDRLARRTR